MSASFAEAALDTLLILMRHQRACPQCPIDDEYCETSQVYQKIFKDELRFYVRSKHELSGTQRSRPEG